MIALEVHHGVTQVRLNGELITDVSCIEFDGHTVTEGGCAPLQRYNVSNSLKPFNELNVLLKPKELDQAADLISASLEIHE